MLSTSNFSYLTLSISTIAIAVLGTFNPITNSPAVAQTTGACNLTTAQFNAGTDPLPNVIRSTGAISSVPSLNPNSVAIQTAARNAALAFYANNATPNVLFSRFDIEDEGSTVGIVNELRGRQLNGCLLEVDVRRRNPIAGNPPQYRVEEIEQQLPIANQSTLPQLPAAVRNRLRNQGFVANRFFVTFIERSIRPVPAQPIPPQGPPLSVPNQVFYEIEGNCTARVPANGNLVCPAGGSGEATVSANGSFFQFELSED